MAGIRNGLAAWALAAWAATAAASERAVEFGGRLQLEAAHIEGRFTDDGRARSATYLRRGEIELSAPLAPMLDATLSLAIEADGRSQVDEASLTWWPGGRPRTGWALRLGRFDPDFGLDPSTSSSWTLALERSPVFDLAPDVASGADSLGLRADHAGRHHVASLALLAGESRDQASARVVGVHAAAGQVWQLGASVAWGSGLADDGRLRSRLGLRAVTEADGGRRSTLARALPAGERYQRDETRALEAAWQQGRLLVQAEWLHRRLEAASRGARPRSAQGHTLAAAWVVSGGARRHEARRARFGRPAGAVGPHGHVEAVVRLDRLQAEGGGRAQVTTLGLAWTPGERWRVAANLVFARADDANAAGQQHGRGVALRVQAGF